jgi:glutamate formiminotransferase
MAAWVADSYHLPVFLYGPLPGGERTLPYVRKHGFVELTPDAGPPVADARSGAVTIGARPLLVAWNLWLINTSLVRAKALATAIRRPGLRTLGLEVAGAVQVSCNLIDVGAVSLADVYDDCSRLLRDDERIARAELVGLAPQSVLTSVLPSRWAQLDLRPDATIEARRSRPAISWPGPGAR